jgi:hypothetical protein
VLHVRYERHVHMRKENYLCYRPWKLISVFPVRYDHHLHKKNRAIPVIGRGGS